MNWYKKARYGGAKQERSIWYHGTRGKNLSKILSEGLIAFPKERSWKEDPDASFSAPSRASLGGIYLTQNLMTARSSALRNKEKNEDMVIVVVEAQPRTFLLDEDSVAHGIRSALANDKYIPNEYTVAEVYMANLLKTNPSFVQESRDNYVKFSLANTQYKFSIPDVIKEKLAVVFTSNWETVLSRQAAYIDDQTWEQSFFRNISEETNKKIQEKYKEIRTQYKDQESDREYSAYLKSLIPPKPNAQNSEIEFANFLNKLTRLLKNFASPIKQKDTFNLTARLEDNIGFTESNRMVCIIAEDNKYEVKLIYGKIPEQLMKDWNTNVGEMRFKE